MTECALGIKLLKKIPFIYLKNKLENVESKKNDANELIYKTDSQT